jgi:hypothetical protein
VASDPALFAADRAEPPAEQLSADRRRTQRQRELLHAGLHPLTAALGTHIPLHPNAAPADNRDAGGHRCGTCRHRQHTYGHATNYPKCAVGAEPGQHCYRWPRYSSGAGTDVRAWWPACTNYEAADRG